MSFAFRRRTVNAEGRFGASAVYIALLSGRMVKLLVAPRNRREINHLRTEFLKI